MSDIKSWSTTAASNNSAAPDGFPEGMAPNGLNDSSRELMASVRTWYEDAEWRDFGDTPTRTGNTTFTVPGDQTGVYKVGRRVRCADSSTLYGVITASVYSTVTTVTLTLDSGNLSASLTGVSVGLNLSNDPIGLIPSGTVMLFYQATAPTGWTKNTTASLNDHALRVVTSAGWTGGTNGSVAFSTAFTSAYTTSSNGAHTHTGTTNGDGATGGVDAFGANPFASPTHTHTFTTASNGAHTHTTNLAVKYLNLILASKN